MWLRRREESLSFLVKSSRFDESTKEICSNKFRTVFCPMSAHTFTLTCIQTMICKLSRFSPTWHPSRSPLVTYSVSNCTQAKNRSHAEAQLTLYQPVHNKGIKYIKRSCYFKRWFRLPTVEETTGRSWHSRQSETAPRHHQASQRTTGKSTWMQGWSSFIIPWGVRFLWILFSLAFLRPFFVTIVSS